MIQGKDTATLDLVVAGLKVSGNLQYRRFEKDNNAGTMSGTLRDSLIRAYYTFQSEGMTSVREVVFLISDSSLLEGYGEIGVKDDTAKFLNLSDLKFLPTPFVKTDCAN